MTHTLRLFVFVIVLLLSAGCGRSGPGPTEVSTQEGPATVASDTPTTDGAISPTPDEQTNIATATNTTGLPSPTADGSAPTSTPTTGAQPPTVTPPPPPPPTSTVAEDPVTVDTESNRDGVFTVRGGQREALPAPNQASLGAGDGVDVDTDGRAILRFADLLAVELLRDGELVLQQLDIADQSAFVTVLQRGGALINDFNPSEEIERRFTIQTEFATITATGTRFAIVREAGSPLEWVVGLDAAENDLSVTADGVTKQVPTGVARWIAPIGEPSAGIEADMGNVEAWLNTVQAGNAAPEIGETVWEQADVIVDGTLVPGLPAPGESFQANNVTFTLTSGGSYAREDCNADGIEDIVIENGSLVFDFRTVLARVRAADVTVLNRGEPGDGALTVFDPARNPMNGAELTAGQNQCEVLSLRSEQPYHYAEFRATNACFLGVSLTPPDDDSAGDPRPVATCENVQTEEETVEPSVRITGLSEQDGRYVVDFETIGYTPQDSGRQVYFFFDTVPTNEVGAPESGPWYLYGGATPFTDATVSDRPEGATQFCVLVANEDHYAVPDSGNCVNLP